MSPGRWRQGVTPWATIMKSGTEASRENQISERKVGQPEWPAKAEDRPEEPLDFQKELIAELKSLMTINEAGNKKKVAKLQALVKAPRRGARAPRQSHEELPAQFDSKAP